MKHLVLFLGLWMPLSLVAQDTLYTYFDSDWNKTDKEFAVYYRKAFKSGKNWSVIDYYSNGQIQMTGSYKSKKLEKKDGRFTHYHANGQKQSEGDYVNDQANGKWIWWYENGQLDKSGSYKKGKKENTWFWYFENGAVSSEETYLSGERTSFKFWDEKGKKVKKEEGECMPEFPGGLDAYVKHIEDNLIYPDSAQSKGIEGIVLIKLIVGKNGNIEEAFVQQSVQKLLDNEALRVVNSMPNFKPGRQHNRPVRVSFTAPIRFKLN